MVDDDSEVEYSAWSNIRAIPAKISRFHKMASAAIRPLVVGLSGATCSGKTTLANLMAEKVFGRCSVLHQGGHLTQGGGDLKVTTIGVTLLSVCDGVE